LFRATIVSKTYITRVTLIYIHFLDIDQTYDEVSLKHDLKPAIANNPALHRFPFVQTSGTTCSRILDLSALKRQPKLL